MTDQTPDVPPADITVTMHMTAEDWRDAFELLHRRRRTLRRKMFVALLPFLLLLYGWWVGHYLIGGIMFAVLALWTIWLFTRGNRVVAAFQARRMLRDTPMLREPATYRFGPEGFSIAVGDAAPGGVPWRLSLGYSQDDKVLILYDAPLRIRAFPRRLVSDQDLAGIVALAKAAGLPER